MRLKVNRFVTTICGFTSMTPLIFNKQALFALPLLLSLIFVSPALARGNDWTITDGMGEEIQVRNGFFGKKSTLVKDRMGNGFKKDKGILGGTSTEASVLGNGFKKKTGIFGGSDISGSTIFGDSVQTKKGIFGRRKTTVDLSGSSKLIQSFFGPRQPARQLQPVTPSPDFAPSTGSTALDPSLPSGGD